MKICINKLINVHSKIRGLNTRWCYKCTDEIKKSCIYKFEVNLYTMEVQNDIPRTINRIINTNS